MVDKRARTRYNESMEEKDLAEIIGRNIMRLRKTANMTQQELAEKVGYSDKSISKWEQGNGLPDIRTLAEIASLFKVSVDDLIHERPTRKVMPAKTRLLRRVIIMLCSVAICWLAAVVAFVIGGIISPGEKYLWLAFVYAIPASAIVVLVFSCIWSYKWVRIVSVSVLIWTALACIYFTVYLLTRQPKIWLIFLVGLPLQALALLFFLWRKHIRFFK